MIKNFIPVVVEEDGTKTLTFDLKSRLMRDRIITIFSDINPHMAEIVCGQLLFLDAESKDPIRIYINSPGGECYSGISIVSVMKTCKSPIETTALGSVCSMGSFIAAAGDKRYAVEGCVYMIHEVSTGSDRSKITDLQISLQESTRLNNYLALKLSEFTNQPLEKVQEDIKRDKWLTAEDAVKYGLCDEIISWKKKEGTKI